VTRFEVFWLLVAGMYAAGFGTAWLWQASRRRDLEDDLADERDISDELAAELLEVTDGPESDLHHRGDGIGLDLGGVHGTGAGQERADGTAPVGDADRGAAVITDEDDPRFWFEANQHALHDQARAAAAEAPDSAWLVNVLARWDRIDPDVWLAGLDRGWYADVAVPLGGGVPGWAAGWRELAA
jgi:hypothetical protein